MLYVASLFLLQSFNNSTSFALNCVSYSRNKSDSATKLVTQSITNEQLTKVKNKVTLVRLA